MKMRNSSFELLRIVSIVMVLFLHTFGIVNSSLNFPNGLLSVLVNSICNIGVSSFILISGYFGVNLKIKKIIDILLVSFFYSITTFLIDKYYLSGPSNLSILIQAIIPVISGKYWFIRSYVALVLLSPFINMFIEKISKRHFRNLILMLLLIFSVIPTFFLYDIGNDSGKGLYNMILMYLIGRYINLYKSQYDKRKLILAFISLTLVQFVLNSTIYIIFSNMNNIFARDYSLFIIFAAILVFLIFEQIDIQSKIVNYLSRYTLEVYISHSLILKILAKYVTRLESFSNHWALLLVAALTVFVTYVISLLIAHLRNLYFGKIHQWIIEYIYNKGLYMYSLFVNKISLRIGE